MPTPGTEETQDDFMKRCIPMVLDEGTAKDNDQAVAICMSMWEEGTKAVKAVTKAEKDGDHPASHYLVVEDPKQPSTWHLRVKDVDGNLDHGLMGACWAALHEGFRGNRYEGPKKQEALAKLMRLYKQEKLDVPGKTFDETLVMFGGTVKALGGGKIGGYLIRFTTDNDPDLEGEFFNKDTDFGDADTAPVYYQHGMDLKLGKRRLGRASHRMDDFGIWAEAQLNLRDEYEKFIYHLAEQGKMGWSSGTAGHLVEREPVGKAVWIKSWPLGLDDTLTPSPAEPRNTITPLKSWQPPDPALTLADRTEFVTKELETLLAEYRGLVSKINRPLSEIKRKELKELLELCSGLDAVRSDLSVLVTAPINPKLVGPRLINYQLAEARKRLEHILQE